MHGMPAPTPLESTPMSWERYQSLPSTVRGEYIDGELVVSAAPDRVHQRIARRLANLLEEALGGAADVDEAWAWKPGDDEFVPDVIVYQPTAETARLTAIPDLVVEVLSQDRSADTVRKFAKYAAAELPLYWVVDPDGPSLLAFELDEVGGFREVAEFGPEDQVDLVVAGRSVRFRPGGLIG